MSAKKILSYLPLALLLIGLGVFAWQEYPALSDYARYANMAISFPYSLDYGEGPLLDQTMRLAHFQNIYKNNLQVPPYTISNYPPMYLLVQVPFAWAFGPALWYGRVINVLCVLLTALFIGLTLYSLTCEWAGALAGGLLLIAFPYIQHWSMFNRIDELALMFSWAAVFVTVRYVGLARRNVDRLTESFTLKGELQSSIRSRGFWIGSILFVLSIYTRQTYALAAPLAVFIWLIFGSIGSWRQRITRAALLGVVVGGIALVLFVLLNLLTAGGFYLNIVTANVNPFSWGTVRNTANSIQDHLYPLLILSGGFALAGLLFVILEYFIRPWRAERAQSSLDRKSPLRTASLWTLVLPYLLAAAAGSITIGKDGSNVNYLLELAAGFALTGGAILAWAGRLKWTWARVPLQLVLLGALAFQVNLMVNWTHNEYAPYLEGRVANISETQRLEEIVKSAKGIVLADEYMGLVPLAGKSLYFQPFEYKMLSQGKVWDEFPFLTDLSDKKFDLILWYRPSGWDAIGARWTPDQISVIQFSYEVDTVIGDVTVYRPKK